MKGRKDGKNGNFVKKNGIYISSFINNEISAYNKICLKIREKYMVEFNQNMQTAKKEIDEMELRYTDYVQKHAQIDYRMSMLDKSHNVEEMIDLNARNEQLDIAEGNRRTVHRNIVRTSISTMELLLKDYDDKIAFEKAHYYQRQMKYLEYAGKYIMSLKTDFTNIENVCEACGISEPFKDERKLIAHFKEIIDYDADNIDS